MNNVLKWIENTIDKLQSKYSLISLLFAVVKKYGEDTGGNLSALIAYFSLLSIFPLMLVFTSISQIILKNNPVAQAKLASSLDHYIPVIGQEIQNSIHSQSKAGITLFISLLIIFYGAMAGANAFQYALSVIWDIPVNKRPGFFPRITRSFLIIIIAGLGLLFASIISEYTLFLGKTPLFHLFSFTISFIILFMTFAYLFKLATPGNKNIDKLVLGAGCAAFGVLVLQTLGGLILTHELKRLHSTYGVFAILLGLAFWIYLETQIVIYCNVLNVVYHEKLYPRTMSGNKTDIDKKAHARRAKIYS
jgi:YihY family inner membrane protein